MHELRALLGAELKQMKKPSPWLAPAIIALVTFVVFLPVLHNELFFDDYSNLIKNPHYRGLGLEQLQWMFSTLYRGHYRPLTWVTLGFDYLVWGMDPFGYHLTSLFLHCANAVLFFFVAQRLLVLSLPEENDRGNHLVVAAAFAALFFAIHPMRAEVIAMATNRKDSLATFFFLWTVWFYLQGRIKPAVCVYALSLLSKASALMLPLALLILDRYPLRKPSLQLRNKIPFLTLAILFGIIALFARGEESDLPWLHQKESAIDRLFQVLYRPGFFVWRTFAIYEVLPHFKAASVFAIGICALTAIVSVCFYRLRKRYPALLASWFYMIMMLAPVLGAVLRTQQLVADRYSYLACLSWAVLLGGLLLWSLQAKPLQRRSEKRRQQSIAVAPIGRAGLVAALAILLVLGSLAWQRTKVWKSPEVMAQHFINVFPTSAYANFYIGKILAVQGKDRQAIFHLRHAAAEFNESHGLLGMLLTRQNDLSGGLVEFQTALLIKPDAAGFSNLGQLHSNRGELEQAIQYLQESIKLRPDYALAYADLGQVFSRQGKTEQAMVHFDEAMRLDPKLPMCAVNFCQ